MRAKKLNWKRAREQSNAFYIQEKESEYQGEREVMSEKERH